MRPAGVALLRFLLLALLPSALVGCGETSRRAVRPAEDLEGPFSGVRMRAVGEVLRTRDMDRVPQLIELLDDPDPGVRMAAGSALRDLTGRDTGYSPWAGIEEQRRQVLEWRAWWGARQVEPVRTESTP